MVAFFFAIHFSVQNRDEVTLRYSIQSIQWFQISRVPLFLVILCSIFLGVLMGGVADLYRYFKLKRTLRQNQRTVERLEEEIRSLRPSGNDRPSFVE
jgi:uncharacterized integral membrane protein